MSVNDTVYVYTTCGDPVENPEIRHNSNSVVGYYGFVRDSGATKHAGYDYIAPKGTDVKAVRMGEIERIRIGKYVNKKPYACKQAEIFTNAIDKTSITFNENLCKDCHKGCYGVQVWLRITNYIDDTYYAYYAHLSKLDEKVFKDITFEKVDAITFKPSSKAIKRGAIIGKSGSTGNAYGMPEIEQHLHFECRKGNGRNVPGKGTDNSPNKIVRTGFFFKNDKGEICDKMGKEDKQAFDSMARKELELETKERTLLQIKNPSIAEKIQLQSIQAQMLWNKKSYNIFKIDQLHLL